MRWFNKWVDRRWLAVGGEKHLVYVAGIPTLATIFLYRQFWWVGVIASLLLLGYFFRRGYRVGRKFMRPTDRVPDEWASTHQSSDYKVPKDKQRG